MSDRNVNHLAPGMMEKCYAWMQQMAIAGVDYIITCTLRAQSEQDALYEQGRTRPGPIVTWTHSSMHTKGLAFDFVIMVNGKPDWSMSHKDMWNKAVQIGKDLGLSQVVGSDGRIKEFAHLQLS